MRLLNPLAAAVVGVALTGCGEQPVVVGPHRITHITGASDGYVLVNMAPVDGGETVSGWYPAWHGRRYPVPGEVWQVERRAYRNQPSYTVTTRVE